MLIGRLASGRVAAGNAGLDDERRGATRSPRFEILAPAAVAGPTRGTMMATIGRIHRFPTPRHLVGYVGLDARVHQSGNHAARHGRISKQGASAARHVLVQAAWAAIKTPAPLHAFSCRVKARRGAQIAIVAVARKLTILTWHLLTTQRDYAYQRPQLVARKLRRLELQTGAPTRRGRSTPRPNTDPHDLQRARHAETRYADLTANWQPHPLRA